MSLLLQSNLVNPELVLSGNLIFGQNFLQLEKNTLYPCINFFSHQLFNFINILIKVPSPDKQYLLYFDGGIPDYRLNRKANSDKTFETPE